MKLGNNVIFKFISNKANDYGVSFVVITQITHNYNQMLIAGGGAFLIGSGMFMLICGNSYNLAIISCIIWTLGEIMAFPTLQLLTYTLAPADKKGAHSGYYQAIFSSSNIVAPAIGGWIYSFYNGTALWVLCGILGLLSLFIAYSKTYAISTNATQKNNCS